MAPIVDLVDSASNRAVFDSQGNKWTLSTGVSLRQGSPAVLILNASAPGRALSYSSDTTRFAKQTPLDPVLAYISYSHNEGGAMDYPTAYPAFIDQILTKWPNAGVVCVTQNPKKAPNTPEDILRHQARCNLIARIAARKDTGLVDAYTAFLETGDPEALIDPDGTHLTAAGSELWCNENLRYLKLALI
ncbi:SGNH/GDSL hydrolase family protein [Paenibacillus sp. TRM 82003]|nr:SGNH/GDSL hydrolase family protein [Paenibacillus sp. TRM 82003]